MEASGHDLLELADQQGIRLTEQRKAILGVIAGLPVRFTASQLLEATAQEAPTVGRATVFRSLQLLCAADVLEQVRLVDGQTVYVKGHPASHHHHLICNSCGKMENIHSGEIGTLAENLAAKQGFSAEGHTFEVYGRCSACQDHRPSTKD